MRKRQRVVSELGFVRLDGRRKTPLLVQLYGAIRTAILDGRLQANSRLPSSRDLVDQLGVSRTTVIGAMDRLLAEGYLQTVQGSGTYVSAEIPDASPTLKNFATAKMKAGPRSSRGEERAAELIQGKTLAATSLSAFAKRVRSAKLEDDHLGAPKPFCPGEPALDVFPTEVWAKIVRKVWKTVSPEDLSYGEPAGYRPLRHSIAEYLRLHRGVNCDWSQVMVCGGTQHAVDVVARMVLEPGDGVLFEDPGYSSAREALAKFGSKIEPMEVNETGARMPVSSSAKLAYVTPSHQYPLGVTMPVERRLEFLNWAENNDAWIIEDDYDSEYRYGQKPIPSMQGLGNSERVFYVGSFSKVICPALGLGYLIVPKPLCETVERAIGLSSRSASKIDQMVLAEFMSEGHFGRHLRRTRKTHATRRELFVELLEEGLGNVLVPIGSQAGLHCTTLFTKRRSDTAAVSELEKAGIITRPLSTYYLDSTPKKDRKSGLVFGFACSTPGQIRRGLKTVAEILSC